MTTFPTPNPAIERAEHPRNTDHIRATARPSYPAGPVPGDARPRVEAERPLPQGELPGAAGKPPIPTA